MISSLASLAGGSLLCAHALHLETAADCACSDRETYKFNMKQESVANLPGASGRFGFHVVALIMRGTGPIAVFVFARFLAAVTGHSRLWPLSIRVRSVQRVLLHRRGTESVRSLRGWGGKTSGQLHVLWYHGRGVLVLMLEGVVWRGIHGKCGVNGDRVGVLLLHMVGRHRVRMV